MIDLEQMKQQIANLQNGVNEHQTRIDEMNEIIGRINVQMILLIVDDDIKEVLNPADLDFESWWECENSPTGSCVYDWGSNGEDCIICHEPSERK